MAGGSSLRKAEIMDCFCSVPALQICPELVANC